MAKKKSTEKKKEEDKDKTEEFSEASVFLKELENTLEENEWSCERNNYKVNEKKKSVLDVIFIFDFDKYYEPMITKGFELALELYDTIQPAVEKAMVWEIKGLKYSHKAKSLNLTFNFELQSKKDRELIRGNKKIDSYT